MEGRKGREGEEWCPGQNLWIDMQPEGCLGNLLPLNNCIVFK